MASKPNPASAVRIEGEKLSDHTPPEVLAVIHAELAADTAAYRDHVADEGWVKAHRGPSALLTLRVPAATLEAIQALATSGGVPVSTVVRGFISEGLASHEGDDMRLAIERLERDVAAVKARVLAS